MLKAGIYKVEMQEKGFTFIELMVVIFIMSMAVAIVVPGLAGWDDAGLRNSARKLLLTARRLSDEAVLKKERQVLTIDLDRGEYSSGERILKLREGISIREMATGKTESDRGRIPLTFYPSGLRDDARITLVGRSGRNGYVIVIPALGDRFDIIEQ